MYVKEKVERFQVRPHSRRMTRTDMEPLDHTCDRVSEVCRRFPEIQFGYLFGSAVQRRLRADSDLDVAVYVDSHGAPATVCAAALLNGRQLYVLDPWLYSRCFLAVTSVAVDFLDTARDYRRIRDRSASLSETDPREP